MHICIKCKKVMRCEKMGIAARWRGTHAYVGDLIVCPGCGYEIIYCIDTPCHSERFGKSDVFMDDYVKERSKINLRRNDGPVLQRPEHHDAVAEAHQGGQEAIERELQRREGQVQTRAEKWTYGDPLI